MDAPTRAEFDALKEQNNILKEQNNQIMDLVLQMREDMKKQSAARQFQQVFGVGDSSFSAHATTNGNDEGNTAEHLEVADQMFPKRNQG